LPSRDGKAKIAEEGLPGLAGVILDEEVGAQMLLVWAREESLEQ